MPPAPTCAASRELVAEIDDALRPATGLAGLLDAAHRVRDRPNLVRSRLAFLRSHPERLAEVTSRAYWHSNGFAKIKLLEDRGFTVRLHVWPAGTGRGEVNPHGHRWEFASWILTGNGMTEAYYEPAEADDVDATRYIRCDYGLPGGPGPLRPRGTQLLRVRELVQRPAGTVYTCALENLHTVAPAGDGLVATVVLQGPAVIPSAPVFVRADRGPEPAPRPIPPAELRELLGLVDASVIEDEPTGSRSPVTLGTYCGALGAHTTPPRTALSPETPQPVAGSDDPVGQLRQKLQGSGELTELERAVRQLRDEPSPLRKTLTALLADRQRLAQIAEKSYFHPNGFAKVVLHADEHHGIRLHVWPAERDPRAGETDPHGHRWDFASWIVAGTLRETTFTPDPLGVIYHRHSYHGVDGGMPDLRVVGTAALRPEEVNDRTAGSVYTRSRGELHTAAPLSPGLVASLVLQLPHAPEPADVYRVEPTKQDPVAPLPTGRLRDLLAAVAETVR